MKKFLSLFINVPVASLAIFGGAVVLVLLAGVNQPGDSLDKNLVPALVIGFGLVVLLWLGAAMEFALAKIRKQSFRIVATLGAFVLVPGFLCVGVPVLIALAGLSVFTAPPEWKMLPGLVDKPVEIVGADHITVYVSTTSGSVARCFVTQPASCWQMTTKPATRILVSTVHERETTNAPATNPPGGAISLLGVEYVRPGQIKKEIHFAILADGSVWYVDRDVSNTAAIFVGAIVLPILIALSLAGLVVVYLGAGVSALARWLGRGVK
jgi:hypothetical protein